MYTELKAIKPLTPFIECIWTNELSTNEADSNQQRILPDGCADLIFNLTPGKESTYWVGTMTTSLVLEKSDSKKLMGIRFNPGGARSFLGMPLSEITDERVTLNQARSNLQHSLDSYFNNSTLDSTTIQNWLIKTVQNDKPFLLVQKICHMIQNTTGNIRVSEMSQQLGISRQYLNRVMQEYVGVDLKAFQRIIRMRLLTERIRKIPPYEINWSDLASEYGFYDQSHLIYDFKDVVGLLPTQFLD